MIAYIKRRDGQRRRGADPDVDPLEVAEIEIGSADTVEGESAGAVEGARSETCRSEDRATLRALSHEVKTSCGMQFALDLGA